MSYDKRKTYSAGILPYTIRNNEIYYLLGRDWRDEGWSDFGGKSEENDTNDTIKTAMREFYEETMGSVLCKNELEYDAIKKLAYIRSVTLNGSPYFMYFLFVKDMNYPDFFHKIYDFLNQTNISHDKYLEKCEISWVSSYDMRNAKVKLRNIFRRTISRSTEALHGIEKEDLREYALKQ